MPQQMLSARQSYDHVLRNAGANYPCRDQVDSFLIQELRSLGTQGALISNETALPMGGPGQVNGGTAPTDTDRDGIPDQWELSHGLNPDNPADGKVINADGYTNLEKVYQQPARYRMPAGARDGSSLNILSVQILIFRPVNPSPDCS